MILLNTHSNKGYLNNRCFSKNVKDYDEAVTTVYQLGNMYDFSNTFYVSICFDDADFDKIPESVLNTCKCSRIDIDNDAEFVSIIMTLQGLVIGLWVCGHSANTLYDPFEYRAKDINKGDIIQYIPTGRYFYVMDDLTKSYNIFMLFGTDEPYCEVIDESILMYYVRKVDDKEIELLGLRTKLESLYNKAIEVGGTDIDEDNIYDNFYHDMIEKYPWL